MHTIKLQRPEVYEQDQKAYDVVTLRRPPDPGKLLEDYIEQAAIYTAKCTVINLCDELEEAKSYFSRNVKKRVVVEVEPYDPFEMTGLSVSWSNKVNPILDGEIEIESIFDECLGICDVYYFEEWAELTVNAICELLEVYDENGSGRIRCCVAFD